MKRCGKDSKNKSKTQIKGTMKQCASKLKSSTTVAVAWSDLDINLVGEIKKRLYWADHVRFGGVCRSWQAAEHEKRPADVLPWLMSIRRENINKLLYKLYEPSAPHLQPPTVSGFIDLDPILDLSRIQFHMSFIYRDGCLFVSMFDLQPTYSYLFYYSLVTKKLITLPHFNHPGQIDDVDFDFDMFTALSTNPTCPDCVFLVLHISNYRHWSIGLYRHGDTQWSTTEFDQLPFDVIPFVDDVVFIRGVFYFLLTNARLGYYDIASGEFKLDSFAPTIDYRAIYKFFGLDANLMLMYYDIKARKNFITSYDWSQKTWVPLRSLGDRSLFLSKHSVYVDAINYYGLSANKIYIIRDRKCYVYSLDNGELLESTSSGLRNWDGLDYNSDCSIWVEPPYLLQK